MKSLGIISEFNPFHNGHQYLLNKAKNELDTDLAISIMSGDFVQRGEAAIMDKFARAEVAIKSGFDMVIEMPCYVSLQAAEFFAFKSVFILDKINVDYLVFGVENLDGNEFLENAKKVIKNSTYIDKLTKKYLNDGFSYPKARNKALEEFVGKKYLTSNNILALEYVRAINKLNSNMKPYPIRRIKTLNKDENIYNSKFASSTAIRKNLDFNIKGLMPDESYQKLNNFLNTYKKFDDTLLYNIFRYKVIIEKEPMDKIIGYEEGLSSYLENLAKVHVSNDDFLNDATSKRYTKSRIKRLILNYILDNEKCLNEVDISFIKILSYNKKATEYFGEMTNNINLIINKKDIYNLDKQNKLVYEKMIQASNIYSLGINRDFDLDYKHNNRPIGW